MASRLRRIARSSGGMEIEKMLGLVILGWLIGAVLLMARLVRKGRKLTTKLATRYPELYEHLGRPRPGFLQSARRSRFSQFISRRKYKKLDDPSLCTQFEKYRQAELHLLVSLLVSLLVVSVLVITVRNAA